MSFEALMLPHLDAAYNLAKWLLGNEQDAQDVVQEAFLRAFKSFSGFHGSNGRAWLLTIVRNTSYTLFKKNRAVDFTTTFDEEIHAPGYDSVSPATILAQSEDAELIREAMDELPAEFREIVVLRHQEGLSYKEIADIAQIPPGTVMSRLARARAKLKEYLAVQEWQVHGIQEAVKEVEDGRFVPVDEVFARIDKKIKRAIDKKKH